MQDNEPKQQFLFCLFSQINKFLSSAMSLSRSLQPTKANYISMFVRSQLLTTLPSTPAGTDLSGRTAIVTGGSSGLGLEAGRQMLALGLSRLILAVRSPDRGQAAGYLLQKTYPRARVEVWPLEMESYESIQNFAERCSRELDDRLDIAILNAGVAELEFKAVESTGHEKTMQVNYHGTMLLSLLLLPILGSRSGGPRRTPGRLTVVNSAMSSFAAFPNRHERPLLASFDDPNLKYDGSERYNVSKLLGQIFLDRLAKEVASKHVVINMVEPGLTKGTNLFRNARGVARLFLGLVSVAGRPTEVGALTYIDAAVVKGTNSHGSWIADYKIAP